MESTTTSKVLVVAAALLVAKIEEENPISNVIMDKWSHWEAGARLLVSILSEKSSGISRTTSFKPSHVEATCL